MDWLEQSVEQNLDDIFAMIGVNTYMRETEKQATSLSDGPPLPFDGPNWRDSLALGALGMTAPAAVAEPNWRDSLALGAFGMTALGALGMTAPAAVAGYGAMTAPEGRRMHGAASAVTRLPFLGAGALGGLGLGTAAGLPLAAAIEPRSKLLAKLVGAGLPIAGGLAGLRLGDYLGKAMAPGPRELGLDDVEPAKKEEKQAGVFTSPLSSPMALHLINGEGQSAPAAVQTHRPTWLGKMVGYADPEEIFGNAGANAASQGLPNAAKTNAEFARLLTSQFPEYFRGLSGAIILGGDVSDSQRLAALSPWRTQLGLDDVEPAKTEEKQAADSSLAAYVKTAVDGAQANPVLVGWGCWPRTQ